jgi:hypothetical protein
MAKKPITALVDADFMVYAAGFAAEHKHYLLTTTDDDPVVLGGPYDMKAKMKVDIQAREETNDMPDYVVWERLEVEDVANALHSVKIGLNKIEERIEKKFKRPVDMKLFLTGTGNYREVEATIKPYKGNRDPRHKPAHMREIRRYMIDRWDAEVIHFREADDEVCIRLNQIGLKDAVIAGLDKDLHQCPGWHYSTNYDKFAKVTERQGRVLLFRQILTGDNTDNIMGLYRGGAKVAKARINGEMSTNAMVAVCVELFQQNIEKYPEQYPPGMTAVEAFMETGKLIYMLRSEDDSFAAYLEREEAYP